MATTIQFPPIEQNKINVEKFHFCQLDFTKPEEGMLELCLSPITPELAAQFRCWLLEGGPAPEVAKPVKKPEPRPDQVSTRAKNFYDLGTKLIEQAKELSRGYAGKVYLLHHPVKSPVFSLTTDATTRLGRCVYRFNPGSEAEEVWTVNLRGTIADTLATGRPIGFRYFPDGSPVTDIRLPDGSHRTSGYWYRPGTDKYGDIMVNDQETQNKLDKAALQVEIVSL